MIEYLLLTLKLALPVAFLALIASLVKLIIETRNFKKLKNQ